MSNHVYITYKELTGNRANEVEVNRRLILLNKSATFRHLTMVSNLLGLFPANFDEQKYVHLQSTLSFHYFDRNNYERVRGYVENVSLVDRPIFHRQQILLLMKKVLYEADDENGLDPNISEEAKKIIGDLCLMINDLLVTPEQENRTFSNDPHREDESDRVLSELLVQMLPVMELMNPPDIVSGIVRILDYLNISNKQFPEVFEGKSLSEYFEGLADISIEKFLQMNVGVYAALITKEIDELFTNPINFNIRKSSYFENQKYTENERRAFFDLTSVTFDELITELSASPLRQTLLIQYDYTVFRNYPLFYLSEDILTPIDVAFLFEKVHGGIYYTILNVLKRNEVDPQPFFQHWGHIFEVHVNNIFRDIYPVLTQRFHPNLFYKSKEKIEAFDGIIEYPASLIAMQYKGGLLNTTAKYSGSVESLVDELDQKFGTKFNKSGIRQLSKNIERLFNVNPSKRFEIDGFNFQHIKNIYPVLIVNDLSLEFGLSAWRLRSWFNDEIAKREIDNGVSVGPLMLLSIEDLERLSPYLEAEDFTFLEFVQFYAKLEYIRFNWLLIKEHWYEPMTTMREVFSRFRNEKGINKRPNFKREIKWDKFFERLFSTFHTLDDSEDKKAP